MESNFNDKRLEARILDSINVLIVNGEIKNPMLSPFASATDVVLSKDKVYAKVYVSCYEDVRLEKSVQALQSASGYIQSRLAGILKTKNTPKLTFISDTTQREALKINALLESCK